MTEINKDVANAALQAGFFVENLDRGDLARLRRMNASQEQGAPPAFWRICHDNEAIKERHERWIPIVAAIALLVPKGDRAGQTRLHDPKRKLGACLCDGGKPGWSGNPFFSEQRLARLSGARGKQHAEALLRAIRMLATSRDPGMGINLVDLAWQFLNPNPDHLNNAYYKRLSFARKQAKPTNQITEQE